MSGIAAILTLHGNMPTDDDVNRMTASLERYGSERSDVLRLGPVVLIHCLQRFTPEDALDRQPLNIQNRYYMVFDGRIDNRPELARRLSLSSQDLDEQADSALAAMAFSRWGDEAWNQIVGVFAILIYDTREHDLRCVRDQMGLRVLHYHRQQHRFLIASSPHPLFTQQGVPCEPNEARLAEHLAYAGLSSYETFYRGIHRIGRGHWLQVSADGVRDHHYWSPLNAPDIRYKKDDDYVEHFRTLLSDVVQQHLRSKTAIASLLSGGLDSSSISVSAAKLLQAQDAELQAYTHVPPAGFQRKPTNRVYFDETDRVKMIASMYPNLHLNLIHTIREDIVQKFDDITSLYRLPSAGPFNDIWAEDIYQRIQAKGINTLLVGEGGNQTFSANGYYLFPELLARMALPQLIREIMAFPPTARKGVMRKWLVAPFLPKRLYQFWKKRKSGQHNYWAYFGAINSDHAREVKLEQLLHSDSYDIYHQPMRSGKEWRGEALRSFVDTACYWQEVRALHGIDIRAPTMDRRIVEFCQGIPETQYFSSGISRWLIRRAMAGRLPEQILNSVLEGAQSSDWREACLYSKRELVQSVAMIAEDADLSRILDHPRLERMVTAISDGTMEKASVSSAEELRFILPVALSVSRFVQDTYDHNR